MAKLNSAKEGDATLLDRTQILYGRNLGNGNNHDTENLPILLAGGGFKHGQHLAFNKTNNEPLPNLFVSMLQRLARPATCSRSARNGEGSDSTLASQVRASNEEPQYLIKSDKTDPTAMHKPA